MPRTSPSTGKSNLGGKASLYVDFVIALGLGTLILAATSSWETVEPSRFFTFLVLAVIGSTMKVRLPGIEGTYSPDFLFLLLGIVELGFAQTVLMAVCCAVVQCVWRPERRPPIRQVAFNVASLSASVGLAYYSYHWAAHWRSDEHSVFLLPLAAAVYFAVNTLLVSGILSILQGKPILKVWQTWFLWAFPYYLVGSDIAIWMANSTRAGDWKISLVGLPLMYLSYISYRLIVRQYTPSGA
jgi:hypothetical protein